MKKRVNYLNNKDFLYEIHKSKCSFCEFLGPEYKQYDAICQTKEEITDEFLLAARKSKAAIMTKQKKAKAKEEGKKATEIKNILVDFSEIKVEDLVIRVMEFDHIPLDETRVRRARKPLDYHVKCNFPPFRHFIIDSNNRFIEVGRSHWTGGFKNGHFCLDKGKITDKLAKMLIKLVDKYSNKSNWRGYSYLDEMKGQAIFQLAQISLQFDESKCLVPNPFSYYTSIVCNSFTRILNLEKRNQNIRDDILQMKGIAPSYTRQIESELSNNERFKAQGNAPKVNMWGRKRKKA